jgi:hypothetical protein
VGYLLSFHTINRYRVDSIWKTLNIPPCDIFFIDHIIAYSDPAHQASMKIGAGIKKRAVLLSHFLVALK